MENGNGYFNLYLIYFLLFGKEGTEFPWSWSKVWDAVVTALPVFYNFVTDGYADTWRE